jgi:hypothetical protein
MDKRAFREGLLCGASTRRQPSARTGRSAFRSIAAVDRCLSTKTVIRSKGSFFEHYKDLETGKWVRVSNRVGAGEAKREIVESIARFEAEKPATHL